MAGSARLSRDEACVVRRGHGGVVREHGAGFVAAAFRHRTSRAQDPHLHTHVIVANLARTADGEWRALDGEAILKTYRLAAGYLYEAVSGEGFIGARVAALATRETKEQVDLPRLRLEWQARAAEHGLGRRELRDLIGRAPRQLVRCHEDLLDTRARLERPRREPPGGRTWEREPPSRGLER